MKSSGMRDGLCGKIKPMGTKIIVGLGNPGKEYERTYHNAGAQALLTIAKEAAQESFSGEMLAFKKHKQYFVYAQAANLVFVLPLTFMNESGVAVKEALKKFGVDAPDLIVLHDESDLTVGTYKIAQGRGAAGHKGVQSIMDALESNDFTRVRIGIRPAREAHRKKAEEFVLAKIKPADEKELEKVFSIIAKEIREIK
jgi:peptidyl-tRNA hydrolase, PTH1 family